MPQSLWWSRSFKSCLRDPATSKTFRDTRSSWSYHLRYLQNPTIPTILLDTLVDTTSWCEQHVSVHLAMGAVELLQICSQLLWQTATASNIFPKKNWICASPDRKKSREEGLRIWKVVQTVVAGVYVQGTFIVAIPCLSPILCSSLSWKTWRCRVHWLVILIIHISTSHWFFTTAVLRRQPMSTT